MARNKKSGRRVVPRRRKALRPTPSNIPRVIHSVSRIPQPTLVDRTLYLSSAIRIHLYHTATGGDTLEFNGIGSNALAIWSLQARTAASGSVQATLSAEMLTKLILTKVLYHDTTKDDFPKSPLWRMLAITLRSVRLVLVGKGSNEDFNTGYVMLDPGEHVPGTTGVCHSGRSNTSSVAVHSSTDLWYNAIHLDTKLTQAVLVRLVSDTVLNKLIPLDVVNPKDFAYLEFTLGLRFAANNDIALGEGTTVMMNTSDKTTKSLADWFYPGQNDTAGSNKDSNTITRQARKH